MKSENMKGSLKLQAQLPRTSKIGGRTRWSEKRKNVAKEKKKKTLGLFNVLNLLLVLCFLFCFL